MSSRPVGAVTVSSRNRQTVSF